MYYRAYRTHVRDRFLWTLSTFLNVRVYDNRDPGVTVSPALTPVVPQTHPSSSSLVQIRVHFFIVHFQRTKKAK